MDIVFEWALRIWISRPSAESSPNVHIFGQEEAVKREAD